LEKDVLIYIGTRGGGTSSDKLAEFFEENGFSKEEGSLVISGMVFAGFITKKPYLSSRGGAQWGDSFHASTYKILAFGNEQDFKNMPRNDKRAENQPTGSS
jgi:hypothetical protein